MAMFSGSRNPMVIVKIHLYRVTLNFKVMCFSWKGCYYHDLHLQGHGVIIQDLFIDFRLLDPTNIDIDTKIVFLACF